MSEILTGIRVVLVEDHEDSRDVLEQMLRFSGALVTSVGAARAALDTLTEADIVITDLSMPGEDGIWLLDRVNAQPRPVPVIVITGFAETQDPRLAGAPFARKLLKPIDPWDLCQIVAEVLQRGS
jgi:CheY-like chemotaxis protein